VIAYVLSLREASAFVVSDACRESMKPKLRAANCSRGGQAQKSLTYMCSCTGVFSKSQTRYRYLF
jgi:hypothetical protein